jgi:hypothetical protein
MSSTRAFLISVALALGGCTADNTDSLIILQNQVLDPSSSCGVPSSATMTAESAGILDVGLVEAGFDGYEVYPLLFNNLVNRASTTVTTRDTIQITGAQVQLQGALANTLPSSQTSFSLSSYGGTVFPNQTQGMSVNVIPAQVALQMGNFIAAGQSAPVIAHFRVTGVRAGGELDSGYVDYPITVCRGCLTGGPLLPCVPIDKTLVRLGSCNPAQDQLVSCCIQGMSTVLCGTQFPTTMSGG